MKTILIVDDDISIQRMLEVFFRDLTEYNAVSAGDGGTAIELISESKPDLILLDMLLPRVGGIALFGSICQSETTKHIPVIFMSGELKDEAFQEEGIKLGAADYIQKPIDLKYLKERIDTLLGTAQTAGYGFPFLTILYNPSVKTGTTNTTNTPQLSAP